MQLIGDTIAVLGARHGISLEPQKNAAYLVKRSEHLSLPFEFICGIEVDGKRYYAPLCLAEKKNGFTFYDQKMGICSYEMKCVAEDIGVIFQLEICAPFRPKDEAFSGMPFFYCALTAENLHGNFRWANRKEDVAKGTVFFELDPKVFCTQKQGNGILAEYDSSYFQNDVRIGAQSCDLLTAISGKVGQNGFCGDFRLEQGESCRAVSFAWCAYENAEFLYRNQMCDFKYKHYYESLSRVADDAKKRADEVFHNAKLQDAYFLKQENGAAFNHLLCFTLHSFLMNTWLLTQGDRTIFSVWEGNCYFNSTVDVEFTQTPFYLRFFPQLLEYELDMWSEFGIDGEAVTGKKDGACYVPHDLGAMSVCNGQKYPHHMAVEESANYVVMSYLLYRTTDNIAPLKRNLVFLKKVLCFLVDCLDPVSGMVELGSYNSMDDASPALQYGRKQIYLGIKTAYALCYGGRILDLLGDDGDKYRALSEKITDYVQQFGFLKDHFAVALDDSYEGLFDSWTGQPMRGIIEGCDAYHIYAENTCAVAASIGEPSLLNAELAKTDIENAYRNTVQTYGCRHTSYQSDKVGKIQDGLAGNSPKSGWISMNILRDIAAKAVGLDFKYNFEKYWEWQMTANSRELKMFFETFAGNNLHFYPRGVAVFGYIDK